MIAFGLVAAFLVGGSLCRAGEVAYVANLLSDSVSVVDLAAQRVTATVPVGSNPMAVALHPDGTLLYVASRCPGAGCVGLGTVFVIETAGLAVVETIRVGHDPEGLAFSPDGARAYVANHGSDFFRAPSSIGVIDTFSSRLIASLFEIGDTNERIGAAVAVAVAPDGSFAYVADEKHSNVYVLDTQSERISGIIPVGAGPNDLAFDPGGSVAYVTSRWAQRISVIDTATHTVVRAISLDGRPTSIAVRPAGRLYAVGDRPEMPGLLWSVDADSGTVVSTELDDLYPQSVAATHDGRLLCVAGGSSDVVSLRDRPPASCSATSP
jgi:YVTN family beta-propeller protein